jgi:hypothetical protein
MFFAALSTIAIYLCQSPLLFYFSKERTAQQRLLFFGAQQPNDFFLHLNHLAREQGKENSHHHEKPFYTTS